MRSRCLSAYREIRPRNLTPECPKPPNDSLYLIPTSLPGVHTPHAIHRSVADLRSYRWTPCALQAHSCSSRNTRPKPKLQNAITPNCNLYFIITSSPALLTPCAVHLRVADTQTYPSHACALHEHSCSPRKTLAHTQPPKTNKSPKINFHVSFTSLPLPRTPHAIHQFVAGFDTYPNTPCV